MHRVAIETPTPISTMTMQKASEGAPQKPSVMPPRGQRNATHKIERSISFQNMFLRDAGSRNWVMIQSGNRLTTLLWYP